MVFARGERSSISQSTWRHKFNFCLIREAWNMSGLFCIVSGELILPMKIRFIETFIKAFRGDLINREREN